MYQQNQTPLDFSAVMKIPKPKLEPPRRFIERHKQIYFNKIKTNLYITLVTETAYALTVGGPAVAHDVHSRVVGEVPGRQ